MSDHLAPPTGIDLASLTEWFATHVPEARPPLRCELITGGRSNLTHLVTDAQGRRWVHRRPPLHSTLASAHDMGREHRIMAALAGTGVPVPRTRGLDTDPEGVDFYVTDHVDGRVIRSSDDALTLRSQERRRAAERLVDVLGDIHAVDPDDVGLGTLARKDSYLARQLSRWSRQWEQQHLHSLPAIPALHRELTDRIPAQQGVSIVHGDYRLDNVILDHECDVAAVLDWELCTLGDALADVGLLAVYWQGPGGMRRADELPLADVEGFPSTTELLERYAAASSRDLDDVAYYVAFGSWKLAIILEGVYTRYRAGAYGEMDDRLAFYPDRIERLLEQAGEQLAGH